MEEEGREEGWEGQPWKCSCGSREFLENILTLSGVDFRIYNLDKDLVGKYGDNDYLFCALCFKKLTNEEIIQIEGEIEQNDGC